MRARGLKLVQQFWHPSACSSRPMRARGLKLVHTAKPPPGHKVAPHAGAWIETLFFVMSLVSDYLSRPMRARGLKHTLLRCCHYPHLSRPMRARGLKHKAVQFLGGCTLSRPMRARGLKLFATYKTFVVQSRAPCGRVD